MDTTMEKELQEHLNRLDRSQQQRVVDFARTLAAREARGVAGRALLRFSGAIERDDLALIEAAIEAGCEQVRPDEW